MWLVSNDGNFTSGSSVVSEVRAPSPRAKSGLRGSLLGVAGAVVLSGVVGDAPGHAGETTVPIDATLSLRRRKEGPANEPGAEMRGTGSRYPQGMD